MEKYDILRWLKERHSMLSDIIGNNKTKSSQEKDRIITILYELSGIINAITDHKDIQDHNRKYVCAVCGNKYYFKDTAAFCELDCNNRGGNNVN